MKTIQEQSIKIKVVPGIKHLFPRAFILLSTMHQPHFLHDWFDGIKRKRVTISNLPKGEILTNDEL